MERISSPVHTERFELEQFVRVQLGNNRVEIGVVTATDDLNDTITVATRHGYDVTINASAVKRAFLIVLDLNGVLVARGKGSFTHRPYVEEFIKFVFKNFAVAVWTSGLERSSNPIIESVFGVYRDRLLFTLYRDACISRPTVDNPYGTVKNLQRIFDTYPKSFHSVNTIIIDDSPGKCSHPDIALCPVPFNDPNKQKNDTGLLQAMTVLEEVLSLDSHIPLIRAAELRLRALSEQRECSVSEAAMTSVVNRAQGITQSNANDNAVSNDNSRTKESTRDKINKNSDIPKYTYTEAKINNGNNCNSSCRSSSNVNGNDNEFSISKVSNKKEEEEEMIQELTLDLAEEKKNNCTQGHEIERVKESKNDNVKSSTEHSASITCDNSSRESKSNTKTVMFNEVNLWNTRLCCEFIRGCCRYGDKCRYRHDRDDGKQPCYRKNHCRFGHATRWVVTDGDLILEQQREHYKKDKQRKENTSNAFAQSTESSNVDNVGWSAATTSAVTNNSTTIFYSNSKQNNELNANGVNNNNNTTNNDNNDVFAHEERMNNYVAQSVKSVTPDAKEFSQANKFDMKPQLDNLHYKSISTTMPNVPRDKPQVGVGQQHTHNTNLQSVWTQTLASPQSIQSVYAEQQQQQQEQQQSNKATILSRFIQSSQNKHRHYNSSEVENSYSNQRSDYDQSKLVTPFAFSTTLQREVQQKSQLHLTNDHGNGKEIIQQLATNLAKTNVTALNTNTYRETKERENGQYQKPPQKPTTVAEAETIVKTNHF